jgi:demethylmenaquinone methyltransferase/2-methoxy-6-polyprenyl-1,4-benzoquinol methylase
MSNNQADLAREKGKKQYVREMFDSISHRYDFLDHVLSFGMDKAWRKKAIELLKESDPRMILDIATGTADLAIEQAKSLNAEKIIGIDISENMLNRGKVKARKQKLDNLIELCVGDSENLTFESNIFDAVSVSFGVRNFENLEKGLREMHRVLKHNGQLLIMEFSIPSKKWVKNLYSWYFNKLVPSIGGRLTGNAYAYHYLPDSVEQFPYGEDFLKILSEVGYRDLKIITLSSGICSIYTGIK